MAGDSDLMTAGKTTNQRATSFPAVPSSSKRRAATARQNKEEEDNVKLNAAPIKPVSQTKRSKRDEEEIGGGGSGKRGKTLCGEDRSWQRHGYGDLQESHRGKRNGGGGGGMLLPASGSSSSGPFSANHRDDSSFVMIASQTKSASSKAGVNLITQDNLHVKRRAVATKRATGEDHGRGDKKVSREHARHQHDREDSQGKQKERIHSHGSSSSGGGGIVRGGGGGLVLPTSIPFSPGPPPSGQPCQPSQAGAQSIAVIQASAVPTTDEL